MHTLNRRLTGQVAAVSLLIYTD